MANKRVIEMAEINEIRCEVYPQERGCERLFYGIGVDTRRLKGERETKDHLKKDCLKRERQGGVEELECGQGGGTPQRVGRRM